MDVEDLLRKFREGKLTLEEASRLLRASAIAEVENVAKFDLGRAVRKGIPEIILGEGKSPEVLLKIALKVVEASGVAIASKLTESQMTAVRSLKIEGVEVEVNEDARIAVFRRGDYERPKVDGKVAIVTAGTADIPIAEEARMIVEEAGCKVYTEYDVGVAGIHRTLRVVDRILKEDPDVVVVVAGREGALPTVIAGLIDVPVVAVPSSQGYGYGGRGEAALMAMLQSCSLGLAVVNIDGGVPAGVLAALIAKRAAKRRFEG